MLNMGFVFKQHCNACCLMPSCRRSIFTCSSQLVLHLCAERPLRLHDVKWMDLSLYITSLYASATQLVCRESHNLGCVHASQLALFSLFSKVHAVYTVMHSVYIWYCSDTNCIGEQVASRHQFLDGRLDLSCLSLRSSARPKGHFGMKYL